MRYEPAVLENIKNNRYYYDYSLTVSRPDPVVYALDVMFINDYMEKNVYASFGDPIELTPAEKTFVCMVILGTYYREAFDPAFDGFKADNDTLAHYDTLRDWLDQRNECDSELVPNGCDSLLDILQGCV